MITDIVPLTISATTMFVQVQMVGESRMFYAVHSTATGLRLGLQRSKSLQGTPLIREQLPRCQEWKSSAVDRLTDDLVVGPTFARESAS